MRLLALLLLPLLASCVALAESSLVVGDCAAAFAQPTAEEFVTRGALSVLLIVVAVRFVRLWPRLADGSTFAKLGTAAACVLFGFALGLWNVAPAVAAGVAGKLIGGFGTGGLAFFGAGVLGPRGRMESVRDGVSRAMGGASGAARGGEQ